MRLQKGTFVLYDLTQCLGRSLVSTRRSIFESPDQNQGLEFGAPWRKLQVRQASVMSNIYVSSIRQKCRSPPSKVTNRKKVEGPGFLIPSEVMMIVFYKIKGYAVYY